MSRTVVKLSTPFRTDVHMKKTPAKACPRSGFLTSWTIQAPILAKPRPSGSRLLMVAGGTKRVRVHDGDGGDWPTSTDMWCWHCCHPFDTQPLPMPIRHDDARDVFHVMGTFCSWACMKAHNLESASYTKSIIANYITLFYKRCTKRLQGIRSAPPRQALKVFGGTMSIEEFRAASDKPVEFALLPPRMIVHHHVIQETSTVRPQHKQPGARQDLGAVITFDDVSTKNETLRLKRPKPLQNNRNLLERTMGINAFKT